MPVQSALSNLLLKPEKETLHARLLEEIRDFIFHSLLLHPLLREDNESISILLAGSTALGVCDAKSDVDLLVVCDDKSYPAIVKRFEEANLIPKHSSFFVELHLPSGKSGHYTLHRLSEVTQALATGNMEWMWNASVSHIYHDPLNLERLFSANNLSPNILYRLRKNTYIQLRNYAKSLDNPVVRGDALSIVFFSVAVFKESLKCALMIDGYPYPYDKWLEPVARKMPVGQRVLECAGDFLVYLKNDSSYHPMFQEDNTFVKMEKHIRKVLVEEFNNRGIDEPWLIEWWKFVEK